MSARILLEIAVKSSLVLLLAWTAARLMDRAAASTRHFVWAVALAAALAMPALVVFGPAWRVAPLPGAWSWRAAVAATTWTRGVVPPPDDEVWPVGRSPRSHAPVSDGAGTAARAGRPDAPRRASPSAPWPADWPALAVRAWAVGAAIGIANLAVGLLWAAWFARRADVVTAPAWIASHASALALMKVRRHVRLLASDAVGVPVACGIVRPSLVLPRDAASWDAGRRRVVLLHELAHVRRRDCLTQALAHLAWAIHWWNPLVWVAVSRLRAEQERACDDLVLALGTPPTTYADHLCDIASRARRVFAPGWATLALARRSRLELRVTAILDERRSRRSLSWRHGAAIALAACLGVVPLGAIRPSAVARAMAILPSSALDAIAPYAPLLPAPRPGYVDAGLVEAKAEPAPPAAAIRPRPPVAALTAESGRAFLTACTSCHSAKQKTANLALDEVDLERVGDNPDLWERVVRKLRSGLHPPAGAASASRADVDGFCASIEEVLDRADQAHWVSGAAEPLADREIAARLAKFLWNAEPDEPLLKLAASGTLRDPATLQQQVRRMIADRRSAAFLTGFFGEWLYLKNLPTIKPDPSLFPEFDEGLRQAFQRETELFLASQVRDDRPLVDLLTANYTFLNQRLAAHYGIPNIEGDQFRRVTTIDPARAGLLGHASVLSVTSYASRTSPVLRGKYLMELWLGASPPPPPANVPAMKKPDPERRATVRTRMEDHRKNPVCAACHLSMDTLGFGLENFDAIGRWRTTDDGLPIDASGTLPDGSRFDGPAQLRGVLFDHREAIVNTIVLKLLAYALGRPARYSDMPAVRAIAWQAAPGRDTWLSTIAAVAGSAPFQMKRIE